MKQVSYFAKKCFLFREILCFAKLAFACEGQFRMFRISQNRTFAYETKLQRKNTRNTVTLKKDSYCVWWVGVCGECNVVNVCVVSGCVVWVSVCVLSVCGEWVCVVSERLCGECVKMWWVCECVSMWWVCGECMSVWRGCACVVSVCAAIECVWGECVCGDWMCLGRGVCVCAVSVCGDCVWWV